MAAVPGLFAADFSDPGRARLLIVAAVLLALLGVLTAVATVWWWRTSRADHPSLGPLEVMGQRQWQRSGDIDQAHLLDLARPAGAERRGPPKRDVQPVDLSLAKSNEAVSFDDLRDEAPAAEPLESAEPVGEPVESELEPIESEVEPVESEVEPVNGEVEQAEHGEPAEA